MKTLLTAILIFSVQMLVSQNNEILVKTRKLMDKEHCEKAIPLLNAYIERDTLSTDAYTQRARCLRKIGKYDKTFDDLKHALRLDSNNAEAYCVLGSTHAMIGKYDLSLESFNKSILIDSGFATAYSCRGALYYYFLNENEMALDDFNKAIKLDPKSYNQFYNRGIMYRLKGDYEKAISDYSKALSLQPNDHLVYNDRGLSYLKLKEYRKAIVDFKKAVKYNDTTDPFEKLNNGPIYDNIGYCYLNLGNNKLAEKYFLKAKQNEAGD